jgi:hypothetical protein
MYVLYCTVYDMIYWMAPYVFRSRLSRAARLGQAVVRVFCLNESTSVTRGVGTDILSRGLQAAFHLHVRTERALRPDLGNDSSDECSRHAGTTFVIVQPIFGSERAHFGGCAPDSETRCTDIQIVIAIRTTSPLTK